MNGALKSTLTGAAETVTNGRITTPGALLIIAWVLYDKLGVVQGQLDRIITLLGGR